MPASDASRAKVTDTHGPFEVGAFAVCRVGGVVALHFGTTAGRFVFHLRERSFVKHARGPLDDNGHPFRSLEQIDAERAQEKAEKEQRIEAELAAAMPTPAPAEAIDRPIIDRPLKPVRLRQNETPPELKAKYIAAEVEYKQSPRGVYRQTIADKYGLRLDRWLIWTRNHARECQAALEAARECQAAVEAARAPQLKPNGKIL